MSQNFLLVSWCNVNAPKMLTELNLYFGTSSHQDCQVSAEEISEEDGRHDDSEADQGPVGQKIVVVVSNGQWVAVSPAKPTHEKADEHQDLWYQNLILHHQTITYRKCDLQSRVS